MAKTKNEKTLEGLIKTRTHIDTMWVKGAWFRFKDKDDNTAFTDDLPEGGRVVGVCLAGSVLYALDYTDEQWTSKKDVIPVIEALYEALPARSNARLSHDREIKDLHEAVADPDNYYVNKDTISERIYGQKVDAIVDFNDAKHRRKADVLALVDQAIENVRAATPITIQEQAL